MLVQVWDRFSSTLMIHIQFSPRVDTHTWAFHNVTRLSWLSVTLGFLHLQRRELLFHKDLAPRIFLCTVEGIMGFLPRPNTHPTAPREGHIKEIPGTPEPPGGIPGPLVTRGPLQ